MSQFTKFDRDNLEQRTELDEAYVSLKRILLKDSFGNMAVVHNLVKDKIPFYERPEVTDNDIVAYRILTLSEENELCDDRNAFFAKMASEINDREEISDATRLIKSADSIRVILPSGEITILEQPDDFHSLRSYSFALLPREKNGGRCLFLGSDELNQAAFGRVERVKLFRKYRLDIDKPDWYMFTRDDLVRMAEQKVKQLQRQENKYNIICADSLDELIDQVNQHLNKGWRIHGDMSHFLTTHGYHQYMQTIVR